MEENLENLIQSAKFPTTSFLLQAFERALCIRTHVCGGTAKPRCSMYCSKAGLGWLTDGLLQANDRTIFWPMLAHTSAGRHHSATMAYFGDLLSR